MTLTYGSYLRLDELLGLQRPESDEHDEILFIVVHQVYELWFKEMLHELDRLKAMFEAGRSAPALHTLKRVLTVLKITVAQTDVLETMSPQEFVAFRDRLETASGSQSSQFRELEFALGKKDRRSVEAFPEGTPERARLEARWAERSVWDAFLRYLVAQGYAVPAAELERDPTSPVEPSPAVQALLVRAYREDAVATEVCERLVDLDEGFQEWRYRHVKMVERTIGEKRGTGGSSGVKFLKQALFQPVFPDLWAIRTEL